MLNNIVDRLNDKRSLIWLIPAFMSLVALLALPYAYYEFLRIVMFFASGYLAYFEYQLKLKINIWIGLFCFTAILFNPLAPVHLERETWSFYNSMCVILFLSHLFLRLDADEPTEIYVIEETKSKTIIDTVEEMFNWLLKSLNEHDIGVGKEIRILAISMVWVTVYCYSEQFFSDDVEEKRRELFENVLDLESLRPFINSDSTDDSYQIMKNFIFDINHKIKFQGSDKEKAILDEILLGCRTVAIHGGSEDSFKNLFSPLFDLDKRHLLIDLVNSFDERITFI